MAQDTVNPAPAPVPAPVPQDELDPALAQQELAAWVAKVTSLSKIALDVTRLCIEVNADLPAFLEAQVAAAVAQVTPPAPRFYRSAAIAPDDLDKLFPPGYGDNLAWHVVCVGRRPGLYATSADADDQVRGIPNQSRKKKDSRQEALFYYRSQYALGECERVSEAPPASHVVVEVVPGNSH
ncbi:hypothetical protein B0H12DRAFT_1240204 [Mycena haematopus]|nr:hypothetical protein B0H12DRAFT_1240204 [Mycena haematopus]